MIPAVKAELVILDLLLPDMNGFSVIEKGVKVMRKPPRILIHSAYCDDYITYEVGRLAILGFVNKPSDFATLMQAVLVVAKGEKFYDKIFLDQEAKRENDPDSFDKLLTNRQRTVLGLAGKLMTDGEIAKYLHLSVTTVEKHRLNTGRKLGLKGPVRLVRYARDHGFPEKD